MRKATPESFIPIPQEVLDKGYKKLVHVKGWKAGCQFMYEKTVNGVHHLITPKTGKRYTTTNTLMYTRRNEPIGI